MSGIVANPEALPMNQSPVSPPRVRFYSVYERIWHWLQAGGILALIFTGLAIHWPERFSWLSFSAAVMIHNALGLLLIANAFLGLFYYLTTGTIRQYLPKPQGFVSLAMLQAIYYMHGIFRGDPHPHSKTPQQRLNPLQQITYLAVLNVLLPLQLVTGVLLWSAARWPAVGAGVVPVPILGAIHTLGAWAFVAFLIGHIYLTTTGQTPLGNIKAMVLGYESADGDGHS